VASSSKFVVVACMLGNNLRWSFSQMHLQQAAAKTFICVELEEKERLCKVKDQDKNTTQQKRVGVERKSLAF
jgi:hypothetical protein